jgi:hypothetical protein
MLCHFILSAMIDVTDDERSRPSLRRGSFSHTKPEHDFGGRVEVSLGQLASNHCLPSGLLSGPQVPASDTRLQIYMSCISSKPSDLASPELRERDKLT